MQNDHLDGAADEAEVARQVIEMLQQQRSPHGVEGGDDEEEDDELPPTTPRRSRRVRPVPTLPPSLPPSAARLSGGIETGFWQLIAALCVEERSVVSAMSRVRQLRKLTSDGTRDIADAHALQEAKMRAHRAEMALRRSRAGEGLRRAVQRRMVGCDCRCGGAIGRVERECCASGDAVWREHTRVAGVTYGRVEGHAAEAIGDGGRGEEAEDTGWHVGAAREAEAVGWEVRDAFKAGAESVGGRAASDQRASDEVAAWERALMRPAGGSQADAAVDEDDGFGGTVVSSAVSEEAEILQRVDEATAALTAEVETLREERQKTKARQLELAESAATFQAQSVGISEEVASANVRCEALHAAGQQGLQRDRRS